MVGLSGAIIAAGRGERLRSAAGGMPKPLVELDGQPLLLRQSYALSKLGAVPVYGIINSETAALIREREIAVPADLKICVRDTANSMESLLALSESIAPGLFLMMTVDAIAAPAELARFLREALVLVDSARPNAVDGAIGTVKWRGDRHPLFAEVAADGVITGLGRNETELVTAGIYLLSTRIFGFAAKARAAGLNALRNYLALLIDEGMRIAGLELTGVIDIDEAADLDAAKTWVASQGGRP